MRWEKQYTQYTHTPRYLGAMKKKIVHATKKRKKKQPNECSQYCNSMKSFEGNKKQHT